MQKLKEFYPVIFITIVVFISIGLLAMTNAITEEKREWQKEQAITNTLQNMFPDMTEFSLEEDVYLILDEGQTIGYAYLALGKGYGGSINILVGLEDKDTIKGIDIIEHIESPGLGAKITEDEYRNQYNNLEIIESTMKFDGGQIDAITGATISSRAVADAVKETALEKVNEIFGNGGDDNE